MCSCSQASCGWFEFILAWDRLCCLNIAIESGSSGSIY